MGYRKAACDAIMDNTIMMRMMPAMTHPTTFNA